MCVVCVCMHVLGVCVCVCVCVLGGVCARVCDGWGEEVATRTEQSVNAQKEKKKRGGGGGQCA